MITSASVDSKKDNLFDQTVYLDRPLKFGTLTDDTGKQQVGFFPYLISEPEPGRLKLNGNVIESYLIESEIDEALVKEYKNRISKIQLI